MDRSSGPKRWRTKVASEGHRDLAKAVASKVLEGHMDLATVEVDEAPDVCQCSSETVLTKVSE